MTGGWNTGSSNTICFENKEMVPSKFAVEPYKSLGHTGQEQFHDTLQIIVNEVEVSHVMVMLTLILRTSCDATLAIWVQQETWQCTNLVLDSGHWSPFRCQCTSQNLASSAHVRGTAARSRQCGRSDAEKLSKTIKSQLNTAQDLLDISQNARLHRSSE